MEGARATSHQTRNQSHCCLDGLRHLRPEQMRQLYQACVTPVVDYASTVWHDPLRDKTHLRQLNTIQRTSLIRILSAFRTVATRPWKWKHTFSPPTSVSATEPRRPSLASTLYHGITPSGVRSHEPRNAETISARTLASRWQKR